MVSWFSFGNGASAKSDRPRSTKALPASWYSSKLMYELERRAIFSKKWILVTHQNRLVETGDFLRITEAGITFFLIKDRQGTIRAHHNVCRHRAYPLVEKAAGTVSVLACKYHGWSYGFDGKLAKAPKYQELEDFDKTSNGLFKVHVHIDKLGFVWVNLASDEPIPWEDDFGGVDEQPRLQGFPMDEYQFDHEWGMMGDYNWKTLADNYNECYHCPTGHPALNGLTDLSKYWVETAGGHIQHFNVDRPNTEGMGIYSTFYYPNASMTISPVFFYIMRCVPVSASQTKMEYEVYRHKDASDESFNDIWNTFKQVLTEDKDLCNAAQKNLNGGIFLNGELHPRVEKGPLFFQGLSRTLVMDHREEEEALGREIWPARPKHSRSDQTKVDEGFCESLEGGSCAAEAPELEW